MKKLLSLLSVLTISGTMMPSLIATSNYQKIINSKKIDRTKRQDNCRIENYCSETGTYRSNIANFFPIRNIRITRPVINLRPNRNYIPTQREVLVGLMRANVNERGVNIDRNYLNVISITSNSAIIESIRSPENRIFYGNFTVNF